MLKTLGRLLGKRLGVEAEATDMLAETIKSNEGKSEVESQAGVRKIFTAQLSGLEFAFRMHDAVKDSGVQPSRGAASIGQITDAFARGCDLAIRQADNRGKGNMFPTDVRDIVNLLLSRGSMTPDEWSRAVARLNAFIDSVNPDDHTKH